MSIIQSYKSNFKVVSWEHMTMTPSGETPMFKVEVLNDFKWEEKNGSEVTQAVYETIGDYIKSNAQLLKWAEYRWEEGQGELDGSCPPFDFDEWLLICIEQGVFDGHVELINTKCELMEF